MACRTFAFLILSAMIVIFLLAAEAFPTSMFVLHSRHSWASQRR
jgi:hypothetical protein